MLPAGPAGCTLRAAVLSLAVLGLVISAAAQDAAASKPADSAAAPVAVALSGGITDPRTLALADLQALPAVRDPAAIEVR